MGDEALLSHVTPKLRAASANLAQARRLQLQRSSATRKPTHTYELASHHHNGIRVESCRSHVRRQYPSLHRKPSIDRTYSYNRYIAVASRVVRRSLKEDKRIAAERRGGESEIKFAKWQVSRATGAGDGRSRRVDKD